MDINTYTKIKNLIKKTYKKLKNKKLIKLI